MIIFVIIGVFVGFFLIIYIVIFLFVILSRGDDLVFDVILVVFIGGVLVYGGIGIVSGRILGILIIGVIN